jgi:hypothetical protein
MRSSLNRGGLTASAPEGDADPDDGKGDDQPKEDKGDGYDVDDGDGDGDEVDDDVDEDDSEDSIVICNVTLEHNSSLSSSLLLPCDDQVYETKEKGVQVSLGDNLEIIALR